VDKGAIIVFGPQTRALSGSRWAWERGHRAGPPPPLDLELHAAIAALVRELVHDDRIAGIHDASDGMGVALAEMAVRSGVGFEISFKGADHAWLFAESASRVVMCTRNGNADEVVRAAQASGVPAARIGKAGGDRLVVAGLLDVALSDAVAAWKGLLPGALGSGTSH
jgi:phosphoribosylformylglycinamidine synthase